MRHQARHAPQLGGAAVSWSDWLAFILVSVSGTMLVVVALAVSGDER